MNGSTSKRNDGSKLAAQDLEALRSKVKGQVVVKGQSPEEEYRSLLERWNRMHIKEASIIVLPESEDDISNTIKFVAEHNLDVAISSGRHTYSGPSSGYGLIIDLRKLRNVTVDVEKKIAIAQGGCLAGDVESACEPLGLRPVMGAINATGCGGITTGGGIGMLSSQYGLVCDNVLSARVALADGRIVVASETENSDLFWGIRGGGSNFGIVTEFTYKVHECRPEVYSGTIIFSPDKAEAVLGIINTLYLECVMKSNGKLAIVGIFGTMHGSLVPAFLVFYDGPEEEATPLLKPLYDLEPVHIMAGMKPYTSVTDFANLSSLFPPGYNRVVGTSTQVSYPVADEVLKHTFDTFKALVAKDPERLWVSKLLMDLRDFSKIASVPINSTAYANRREGCIIAADIIWNDSTIDAEMFQQTRDYIGGLRSKIKSVNEQNGIADESAHVAATTLYALLSDGQEKLLSVFGPNLPQMRKLKGKYDPGMMWDKWYPVEPEFSES